jgi:hypothetical protein
VKIKRNKWRSCVFLLSVNGSQSRFPFERLNAFFKIFVCLGCDVSFTSKAININRSFLVKSKNTMTKKDWNLLWNYIRLISIFILFIYKCTYRTPFFRLKQKMYSFIILLTWVYIVHIQLKYNSVGIKTHCFRKVVATCDTWICKC